MNSLIYGTFISALYFGSVSSFAQVSPATSTYLRPVNPSSVDADANFESGRFVVRPQPTNPTQIKELPAKESQTKVQSAETKVILKPIVNPPENASEKPLETKIEEQSAVPHPTKEAEFKNLIFGEENEDYEKYLSELHAKDPRLNILNLSLAPSYFYVDSSSAYWFRDYASSGPGISVLADVWVSPFFGIHADYFTTLAAELKAEPGNSKDIIVDHRYFNGGLQIRKFTSTSRKAESFTVGLLYAESEMIVPREETKRTGIKMSGLGLSLGARIPSENDRAWLLDFVLYPNTKVHEVTTATAAKSGSDFTSYGFKASFGKEWVFDRSNNIFIKLSHRVDKTIYEGSATVVDPRSNTTPEGVSVTSGSSLLEFGFTWGD